MAKVSRALSQTMVAKRTQDSSDTVVMSDTSLINF